VTSQWLTTLLLMAATTALASASKSAAGPDSPRKSDQEQYRGAARGLLQRARGGEAHAQFLLGLALEHGEGVKQDYMLAREWYEKAAQAGEPGRDRREDNPGEQRAELPVTGLATGAEARHITRSIPTAEAVGFHKDLQRRQHRLSDG